MEKNTLEYKGLWSQPLRFWHCESGMSLRNVYVLYFKIIYYYCLLRTCVCVGILSA